MISLLVSLLSFLTSLAIYREMSLAELKEKYRRLSTLEKARSGWEGEYDASSKQVAIITYKLLLVFMVFITMHNAFGTN